MEKASQGRRLSRRAVLKTGLAGLGSIGAAGAYAWLIEPQWVEVVTRTLYLPALPQRWVGRTVVQVSDLHVGTTMLDYLARQLEWVADRSPDAVFVTGDWMTALQTEHIPKVSQLVETLRPRQVPVFATLGNHDYGRRCAYAPAADGLAERLRSSGVTVLRNDVVEHDGLPIVGLEDYWTPWFDSDTASRLIREAETGLLLSHNPDTADLPMFAGWRGAMLAGHTHGGQCRVPFGSAIRVPVQNEQYVAGDYALADRSVMYINRGLGYSHRLRFACRPEITVFELREASYAAIA
jgi:hypothetical protein